MLTATDNKHHYSTDAAFCKKKKLQKIAKKFATVESDVSKAV
jgi:hypothetical protein